MLIVKPVESSEYIPVSDQYNCEVAGWLPVLWQKRPKSIGIYFLLNIFPYRLIVDVICLETKKNYLVIKLK
jgi:hypothetical protein